MRTRRYWLMMLLIAGIITFTSCSKPEDSGKLGTDQEVSNKAGKEADRISSEKETSIGDQDFAFSKQDYFYSQDLEVDIISKKPGTIYYTLDGKDPDKKQKLYEQTIKLPAGNDTKVTCIKAKAYFEDGTESDTIIHSYFVGKNVMSRFNTLVFSVTTDPYNLYDYEHGIFVPGKLRDDYIKKHPNDKINPDAPANFNIRGKESEREVYLEILEPNGAAIVNQAAGVRAYGGWSRANAQKSMKLYARKEYDEKNNKFRYEFFPQKTSADGKGNKLDTFKQLVVRNCGNDNGFGFIRNELFQTLAGQAGYKDYEAVRPVTLFVNGEYRGFLWLHEVYSDEYFEDHYGTYSGDFEILEGGENFKKPDTDEDNSKFISDYEDMYSYARKDLTDNATYEELCKLVDVENYLSYYALQIYIGNEDWPENNYKTYRYYAAEGEEYREAPFDGKWRYLLHDLDFSFGIYDNGVMEDNISEYIGEKGEIQEQCPLFGQLMKREDCREIFIKKTLDLINGAFQPKNLSGVLDEMNASRLDELKQMYGKNLMEDWVQYNQLQGRLSMIKTCADQRTSHILTKYQEYFGLGDIYKLTVQPAKGIQIKINTYTTDKAFDGSYYTDYNTTISAIVMEGKKLDYWQVNGEKVESEELVVTPAMIKNNKVEVTCVLK